MEKKTGVVEKQNFTKKEVNLMLTALRFVNLETNEITGLPYERKFTKQYEKVALETFKELVKANTKFKWDLKLEDIDISLGSLQKTLLVWYVDGMEWTITDLEAKGLLLEKLQK